MNSITDYRVNQLGDGSLISVEITCCGKHIGEIRFKNGAHITCPHCQATHKLKIQHNHFHLTSTAQEEE